MKSAEGRAWVEPLAILLATGALLGLTTNLAKVAASWDLAPLPFLAWSVAGSGLAMLALAGAGGRLPRLDRRRAEYYLAAALLSVALPNLIFFAAVPRIGAGFVALVIAFPPLFTYLAAVLLGMERPRIGRALGVTLALAGAALIALLKLRQPATANLWVWLALLGPVILAAGNIYRSWRWPPGAEPETLATGMMATAGLLLLLAGAWPGLSIAVPLDRPGPLVLILVQAALFTLQYRLFFRLQKLGGPVYLSLLGAVGAVAGVPIAVFLLGEAPPDGLAPGAALIGVGIFLLTRGLGRA